MKVLKLFRLIILLSAFLASNISFSQENSFSYTCPADGSLNLNPEQNIILRSGKAIDQESFDPGHISVSGNKSGDQEYDILFSRDGKTLILKPINYFTQGETVTVRYKGGLLTEDQEFLSPLVFRFGIHDFDKKEIFNRLKDAKPDHMEEHTQQGDILPAGPVQDNNLPSDYPPPTIINYEEPDDKYFFYNTVCRNFSQPWKSYITIVDAYGIPIYYKKSEYSIHNFSLLQNGLLCYAVSTIPNSPKEKYYIADSTYTIIDSINTGNGYILDSHDMLLLSNGHYLVMSYDPQPVNMSQIVPGGNPEAIVTGLVIQEVDNNENVFFQWRSWDHFDITDATDDIDLTAPAIDYVHGNAFEIDTDGNILLSSRNMDEITKIDFNTGAVIWRFGLNASNNMFQIQNDPIGFSHQHDIRKLSNGRYTVYDNGNLNNPQESRALEYVLNQQQLTADLVWSYNHPAHVYASSTGSFRVLENDQKVIGWGGTWPIAATVVNNAGEILQQMFLPDYVNTYRVLKYEWENAAFRTREFLSMGNYARHGEWKYNKIYVHNTCNKVITITSTYNENDAFVINTELPISIFPGYYKPIEIGFKPGFQGDQTDHFTLNFDNEDNSQRIATQFNIQGYWEEETPSVHFTPSYDSTGVSPNTVVEIAFSEPVSKVIGGEIQNSDIPYLVEFKKTFSTGEDVSFTGTINEGNNLITLIPDQALQENQQYYIKLHGNLLIDEDENVIRLSEESYFKTGLMTSVRNTTAEEFLLFPNPTGGNFLIGFDGSADRNISILNTAGLEVISFETNKTRLEVDLSDQPAGIYYVQVKDLSGHVSTRKIVKQ